MGECRVGVGDNTDLKTYLKPFELIWWELTRIGIDQIGLGFEVYWIGNDRIGFISGWN